jgi:hypothetical protein
MWILNQTRDSLVNLQTGLRIVVMPTNKQKDSEVQLYGVVVQAPAEATLPLGRPMPTGFSNTVLMHGAPLEDCQNLLATLTRRLEAYQVGPLPVLPPEEDDDDCYILVITGGQAPRHLVTDDSETAWQLVIEHVKDQWPRILPRVEVPQDDEAAVKLYFEHAKEESYQIYASTWYDRADLERITASRRKEPRDE